MAFSLDDYSDVAERIDLFYKTYPDGRLMTVAVDVVRAGDTDFATVKAFAYRTPDDLHPGVGIAWERVPGKTPYTRDSELMNAETSAWGRAIVSLGFKTKKIASKQEVRNRREDEKAEDFADKMRTTTKMKANDIKTYLAVGDTAVSTLSGNELATYLNSMSPEKQEALYKWATEGS